MEDGGYKWKIGLSIVFLGVTCILLIGISMLFINSSWNGNCKLGVNVINILFISGNNSTCLLNKKNASICENVTEQLEVSRSSYF